MTGIHSILWFLITKDLKKEQQEWTLRQWSSQWPPSSCKLRIHCVQLKLCLQQSKSLICITGYRSTWSDMKEHIPWLSTAPRGTTHNSHNWNHCGTKILTLNSDKAHIIIVFIQAWHVEQRSITAFLPLGAAACRGQSCGMGETWKPDWQWDDHLAIKFRTCIRPSFQHNSNFAELGKEVLKNTESPPRHEIAKSWQVTPQPQCPVMLHKHLQPGRCFSGKLQYFCRNSSACRSCAPQKSGSQDLSVQSCIVNVVKIRHRHEIQQDKMMSN